MANLHSASDSESLAQGDFSSSPSDRPRYGDFTSELSLSESNTLRSPRSVEHNHWLLRSCDAEAELSLVNYEHNLLTSDQLKIVTHLNPNRPVLVPGTFNPTCPTPVLNLICDFHTPASPQNASCLICIPQLNCPPPILHVNTNCTTLRSQRNFSYPSVVHTVKPHCFCLMHPTHLPHPLPPPPMSVCCPSHLPVLKPVCPSSSFLNPAVSQDQMNADSHSEALDASDSFQTLDSKQHTQFSTRLFPPNIHENYRLWQRYCQTAQVFYSSSPDVEALACFFMHVICCLTVHHSALQFSAEVNVAVLQWNKTSTSERGEYYTTAQMFIELEEEEKRVITAENLKATQSYRASAYTNTPRGFVLQHSTGPIKGSSERAVKVWKDSPVQDLAEKVLSEYSEVMDALESKVNDRSEVTAVDEKMNTEDFEQYLNELLNQSEVDGEMNMEHISSLLSTDTDTHLLYSEREENSLESMAGCSHWTHWNSALDSEPQILCSSANLLPQDHMWSTAATPDSAPQIKELLQGKVMEDSDYRYQNAPQMLTVLPESLSPLSVSSEVLVSQRNPSSSIRDLQEISPDVHGDTAGQTQTDESFHVAELDSVSQSICFSLPNLQNYESFEATNNVLPMKCCSGEPSVSTDSKVSGWPSTRDCDGDKNEAGKLETDKHVGGQNQQRTTTTKSSMNSDVLAAPRRTRSQVSNTKRKKVNRIEKHKKDRQTRFSRNSTVNDGSLSSATIAVPQHHAGAQETGLMKTLVQKQRKDAKRIKGKVMDGSEEKVLFIAAKTHGDDYAQRDESKPQTDNKHHERKIKRLRCLVQKQTSDRNIRNVLEKIEGI